MNGPDYKWEAVHCWKAISANPVRGPYDSPYMTAIAAYGISQLKFPWQMIRQTTIGSRSRAACLSNSLSRYVSFENCSVKANLNMVQSKRYIKAFSIVEMRCAKLGKSIASCTSILWLHYTFCANMINVGMSIKNLQ